ncbi:hypothetical protein [Sphingomonas aurantiaca]|uniref:hypothetical protein n=1 Tax=Sphingomonas aurantiaca TaxID=185949 RepID=UPI003362C910
MAYTPDLNDYARSSFVHHNGGPCPIGPETDVLVIHRRMSMEGTPDFATGKAADFAWEWNSEDPDADVVSYRLTSQLVS